MSGYFLAPCTHCKNLREMGVALKQGFIFVTIQYNTGLLINSAGGTVCLPAHPVSISWLVLVKQATIYLTDVYNHQLKRRYSHL